MSRPTFRTRGKSADSLAARIADRCRSLHEPRESVVHRIAPGQARMRGRSIQVLAGNPVHHVERVPDGVARNIELGHQEVAVVDCHQAAWWSCKGGAGNPHVEEYVAPRAAHSHAHV